MFKYIIIKTKQLVCRYVAAVPSAARTAFADAYDRLFLRVVAPAVAAAMPGETRLLYAAFPCVRIQQPCDFHTIRCHVDSMYCHPAGGGVVPRVP